MSFNVPMVSNNGDKPKACDTVSYNNKTAKHKTLDKYYKRLEPILEKNGISLDRTKTNEKFFDQDEIVFYERVLTRNKERDSYLITGNIRHFPKKTFVVTPSQMLEIIESN